MNNQYVSPRYQKSVIRWLICCALLILLIIGVGGVTRLTDSGLSMVEWRPVYGILPPVNKAQWTRVFDQYKKFPEYQKINKGMSLSDFKKIFFWEYLHRVLGRVIGMVFFFPFLFFLLARAFRPVFAVQLFFIFLIGAAQGLMGWYMVQSGLINRPSVAHLRLMAHLLLAFFLLGTIFWQILKIKSSSNNELLSMPKDKSGMFLAWSLMALLMLQIGYGAMVAGLDAGLMYNTFPKMGPNWVPQGLNRLDGLFNNMKDNPILIQFIHRILAFLLVSGILLLGVVQWKKRMSGLGPRYLLLLLAVGLQFFLGVLTILWKVPVAIATFHQIGAAFLMLALLNYLFGLKRRLYYLGAR